LNFDARRQRISMAGHRPHIPKFPDPNFVWKGF
jgi:hypothetical protein